MHIRNLASVVLALGAALSAAPAVAQDAQSPQVLDRVFTFDTRAVLNMATGNANTAVDYTNLGLNAAPILTCSLTPADGLYCLDGRSLRKWANPLAAPPAGVTLLPGEELFKCTDAGLGFDAALPLCTGMTVDKSGVIWLSGKKKLPNNWPARPWWIPEEAWLALQTWFSPYSVVKVTKMKATDVCALPSLLAGGGKFCATPAYSGKYLVTRLSAVDGDAAKNFHLGPGVLGIEDFRNVVFFPSALVAQPVQITGGWSASLKFGEVFDDVSFLVFNGQSNVLATTNFGRVLSKNTASGGTVTEVFNIPSKREPGSVKCSIAPSQFGIRSAPSSAIVFVTDRQYCQVPALKPEMYAGNFRLVNIKKDPTHNLTLLTKTDHVESFPVIGLTLAPGIGVDLSLCKPPAPNTPPPPGGYKGCPIINAAGGQMAAASLLNVKLVEENKSGVTVFQMKDIPDCRYAGDLEKFLPADRDRCALVPTAVVTPSGAPALPGAQLLNATKLLSGDVIAAFASKGVTLPDLLISRQYRGQRENNYRFGALFIIPTEGVKYKGVFQGDYNVLALQGKTPLPPGTDDPRCVVTVANPGLSDLLNWNVTTAVSETFRSIDGKYIDSVTNVDCGSVKGSYGRLSLLPYDLELAPDTYGPTILPPWTLSRLTKDNDAVFARLVSSLIDDLSYVFKEQACKPTDQVPLPPNPVSPLPWSVCSPNSTASQQLGLLRYKFDRCIVGAFTSKYVDDHLFYSLRNRPYCGYALDRLNDFQAALPNRDSTNASDIANRLGELHSRVDILRHVYTKRFQPSIPDRGFCKELGTCSYHNN